MKREAFNRNFGCEFEFTTRYSDTLPVVLKAINSVYKYNNIYAAEKWHRSINNKKWHLKLDSSTGCEFVTPVMNYKDLPKIKRVIKRLSRLKITKADAFHIHMYAKDIPYKQLVIAWLLVENNILSFFPLHRRKNEVYCKKLVLHKNKQIAQFFEEALESAKDHHAVFSIKNYNEYGTVEFRICEGTNDIELVESCINLFLCFLQWAKTIDCVDILCNTPNTDKEPYLLFDKINIPEKTRDFLKERYNKFNRRVLV